ncbi:MAG: putative 4-hydroxybenzoate polyprenyltransferase [Selenomonadaceae bacterium]|nr:putative 4-hydroxybenzoate polyprenyltransferase [Selenomonadaceae bacterium]
MIDIKLKAHANNIALPHMIFALPFAFMAALLVTHGDIDPWILFLIAAAVTSARSAALALNNLADLKYDRLQPRMSYRAMVRGDISKSESVGFIVLCLATLVLVVIQLPPVCMKLLPVAVVPFLIYPFTKRFTGWCHLFLGLAISMAPAGGWIAAGGWIDLPMILLCVAVALWIGAFDAIYGAQDRAFDLSQHLHSLATEFGVEGALKLTRAMHAISIVCFIAVGLLTEVGALYYVGVLIAALTLVWQHSIVKPNDFSRVTQAYFMRNGIVSIAMLIFTWLSL